MEKASDDESLEDAPPDDASQEGSEFVEMDPSGRYGRYKEMLGKGAYKTVYKAFDDLDGIEVAWNQVKIHDVLHHAGDIERLYSELHLLKTLKHKNIIKFYTSWVDMRNRNVNFITEIFTSGTLRHYRKKHQHVKLRAIKNWSRQILRGLVFLHSRDPPIIHRDLKCDNIFINGNTGEVKIGDLGLATILRQAPAAQSVIGTPEFMAPELYEEHYNELVDVYSFGMCLLEMLTSEYPYSECTNAAQIYKKVTTGKKPAALGKIKDHETREFVEKCLTSASQRLHARELLMDPFLLNDEDLEVQDTKICGSSNFRRGSLHGLDPIPENTYVSSADCYDELRKKSCSTSEGFSRVDTCYERIALSDSSSPKEETKSCLDFRIKGRKQDDKKVLVRIRIANSGGEVRIIQFDFDVDADTAMSVASEMVAELDLSDQDVTVIAEMIDAEIMALIPDWKPGLALDDTIDDDAGKEPKGPMIEASSVQDESDGLLISTPAPGMAVDTSDDSQLASNPTYGRFEEVGCNVISLDQQEQDSDGLELFSDFSVDTGSDSSLDAQLSSESGADNGLSAHNLEVIETKMKLGSLPSSGEGQPGVNDVNNEEECTIIVSDDLPSSGEGQPEVNDGNNEEECSIIVSDEKFDDTEVGRLIMQQQEELQMLQTRHEEALSYLRTRLSQEATRTGDKPLPTEHLTCAISGGVFQLSGKEDDSHIYAASEVCLRTAEEACSSISILNDPPAAIDKSKGVSFASIAPLEIALTDSVSIADNVKGSHDIISAEITGTMPKGCLNEKDDACGEGDPFVGKGNDVAKDKLNREPDFIAVAGLAETRTNALCKSAQASKATAEVAISVKGSTPPINEDGKLSFPTLVKRESYLELYKASNSKDKSFSSKPSELPSTADGASKIVSKDANQEQLKKMADFADKLINNLTQGNSKYLGTSVKNPQNGQQGGSVKSHGGTSIQGGQHPAVTKSVSGAVVPNGQLSSGVKNITSVSTQNLQQGSLGKNRTISVVQTSSVEKLSNAVTLNGQQDASMKGVQVSQSGATGKCLSGANAHNGQQSGLSLNQTNASTHTTNQGAASGCLTTTFPNSASAKGLTSGNS